MNITWLASYPKSGNTWVRFLLHAAIYGTPKNSLDIAKKIPDIHRPLPFDPPTDNNLLCKTHFAYSPKHPKIAQSKRAVLIIRDPRDVFFSVLNYRRLSGLSQEEVSDKLFAQQFIAAQGDPNFKALGFGTLESHARSWQGNTQCPVLTIKYEDLKTDPSTTLKQIGKFMDRDFTDDTIAAAVKSSSFDSMRAMEIREKHQQSKRSQSGSQSQSLFVGTDAARQSKVYFMNTGKTGQSLASISPAIEKAFNETFAPYMESQGYSI